MTYGLPYKGSKTKLAERIFIPRTQEYVKDNRKYKKTKMNSDNNRKT